MESIFGSCYGYLLTTLPLWQSLLGSLVILLFLGFFGMPLIAWAVVIGLLLTGFGAAPALIIGFMALVLVFLIKPERAVLISSGVMKIMHKLGVVPKISATERTALEAGVVWIEKDLFSGNPDFKKIMNEPYGKLTAEEELFMKGPVEELCQLCDPWKIWKNRDIPQDVIEFAKKKGFFGMIIPKEYGGLGFTAMAHSEVVQKVASRSLPMSITIMVPNSLGPAELLIHYGTEQQKNYWLPRLASGAEIPCFGLTEPTAGSDAGWPHR